MSKAKSATKATAPAPETTATPEAAATNTATAGEAGRVTAEAEAATPAPAPEPVSGNTLDTRPLIKPTVGRRVHFWPNAEHQEAFGVFDAQQPCDAGIVYVWGNREVNVEVTGPSGVRATVQNVRLLQGDDEPVEGKSYAAWMDYQVTQALKQTAA